MLPIDSLVKYWVKKNNCNTTPTFSNVPNTSTSDGCTAEHYIYSGGNLGSSVELYKIIGGAHTWPGAPISIGVTNQDVKASKEIWRFFSKYNLATLTSVNDLENEKLEVVVYPNPAGEMINVKLEMINNQSYSLKMTNILSEIIFESDINIQHSTFNIQHLQSGVYFVTLTNQYGKSITKKIIKE